MIQLERHIEILLLDNDCVIIPDFGGFVAHHVDARYDAEDQLFIPPLRTLGFNPQLKFNDSLLAQSYAEAYDISYPEALARIQDETRELKDRLSNEGRYEMNDIGTLSLNADGNYEFEPCEAGILTPDCYGFSTFEMLPLTAGKAEISLTTNKNDAQENNTSAPQITTSSSTLSATTASTTTEDTEKDDGGKTVSIKTSLIRNIAAACIAVIAFLLWPSPLEDTPQSTATKAGVDTQLLYRVMPKNTATGGKELKQLIAKKTAERAVAPVEETAKPSTTTVTKPQSVPTSGYCVVLASNVSHHNARAFIKQLAKQGLDNCQIREGKRFARVTYGWFPTRQEAQQERQHLSRMAGLSDCWIMKVN